MTRFGYDQTEFSSPPSCFTAVIPRGKQYSMLFVRKYGYSGPLVIVLHGGPGAPGHMAPVARGLADLYRVREPFQRASGEERLTVAKHVEDLHEVVQLYARDSRPALLGSSWGAMLALAYAATHPDLPGPLILVGCGTFDLIARARMQETIRQRMNDQIRERLASADQFADKDQRLKATAEAIRRSTPTIRCQRHPKKKRSMHERSKRRGTIWYVCRQKEFIPQHSRPLRFLCSWCTELSILIPGNSFVQVYSPFCLSSSTTNGSTAATTLG